MECVCILFVKRRMSELMNEYQHRMNNANFRVSQYIS